MDHNVFCRGPLLHAVQMSGIFTDSKSFVDRPLLVSPEEVLTRLSDLGTWPNINQKDLRDFVDSYFGPVGSDIEEYDCEDFHPVENGGLPIIKSIRDEQLRSFAEQIHNKWKDLGRKISDDVDVHPERHTIISLPHPFIVPGGRFREIYYWDSFWTIQGLLVSGMHRTAKGMLLNFAYLIDKFGLIPNGNRIYYTKRSEPPLFALMVEHYAQHASVPPDEADALVKQVLPALEKEYDFWINERSVGITLENGQTVKLNRYTGGDLKVPRPESYWEDFHDGLTLESGHIQSAQSFYGNIAAAAESGLDFSTRWLDSAEEDFLTMRTETIVPVDLNAFLFSHEQVLSRLYLKTGNLDKSKKYQSLSLDRADAMHKVFWNEELSMWRDYDLKQQCQRSAFYLANIAPLFARCDGRNVQVTSIEFMQRVMLSEDFKRVTSFPGGFPASFTQSIGRHCQWDLPNAWPPLQLMLIEGFYAQPSMRCHALQLAQKWLEAVYTGFAATKQVYEKYDVRAVGQYGSGGEYLVQEGFGWTNGGILRILELFPQDLRAPVLQSETLNVQSENPSCVIDDQVLAAEEIRRATEITT